MDSFVKYSWWPNGGLPEIGMMPRGSVQARLNEFEAEAHRLLKATGADHVLYAVKVFNSPEAVHPMEVRFYEKPMSDEEFQRNVANKNDWQVYAAHAMN